MYKNIHVNTEIILENTFIYNHKIEYKGSISFKNYIVLYV